MERSPSINYNANQEMKRVQAVRRFRKHNLYNLENLEELVTIASNICQAPIAYISLIDEADQVFIAKKGLDIEGMDRTESFCDETIQQPDLLVIEDASRDPKYSSNPFVAGEPFIRFYAGMPVKTLEGDNIGTICVIDKEPHQLTDYQKESLKILANQAIYLIQLRMAVDVVNTQKELIRNSEAIFKDKFFAQNEQIKSIAVFLAHQVSGPVASMKGLMTLAGAASVHETNEYMRLMEVVLDQMDEAVRLVSSSAFNALEETPYIN
ncbi:GAF domain-containing protein [Pedobacter sp. SYSU D00535]|uniref:GAF domain-containing protein n=1 Tax=Pedobacter sp. SYSU D00535 TaxID=2810308 RepID=UPI001A973DD4|nr:GAF domain-containing protein [Pedobacter sp. SYSU D00535]